MALANSGRSGVWALSPLDCPVGNMCTFAASWPCKNAVVQFCLNKSVLDDDCSRNMITFWRRRFSYLHYRASDRSDAVNSFLESIINRSYSMAGNILL